MSYFDVEGKPTLSGAEISIVEYQYDENGNMTQMQFFNIDGKPTKGTLGYAKNVYTYDENGHLLTQRYYGVNDKPIIVDEIAGENYKRDARGNIIEEYSVGTDGKLAKGYLVARYKYDEKDNLIEWAVFDADGRPKTNYNDIHKYTQKFNSRNQCIETCYYNTNGSLTTYSDNTFCIVRQEYNDRGLNTRTSYFDKNDKPVEYKASEGRYASMASEYDMYGRVIRQCYFDKNGAPTDPKVMVPEPSLKALICMGGMVAQSSISTRLPRLRMIFRLVITYQVRLRSQAV
jgi:serine/threonine-protein kinase